MWSLAGKRHVSNATWAPEAKPATPGSALRLQKVPAGRTRHSDVTLLGWQGPAGWRLEKASPLALGLLAQVQNPPELGLGCRPPMLQSQQG